MFSRPGAGIFTAFCCLFLFMSMASAQSRLPNLGDIEREEMSPQMEHKLGVEIMEKIRQDPDYISDDVLREYVNNLGNKLLAANPEARGETGYDFFFFVVRDSSLNAFALPGGFIGVHTGLLVAAQSESELASVLSHEIGHVTQRHIARMLGKQRQDMLIPIASAVLAILAARSNADVSGALLMGGQGLAIQRQLNFSRDAEREADRVGFLMLRDANFDPSGMSAFFGRLQAESRGYTESISAYLRTHPLTSERIADIEGRVRSLPYKQHADFIDFYFMRARAQVLQNDSTEGLRQAATIFEERVKNGVRQQVAAGSYGLALIALKQGNVEKANTLFQQAKKGIPESSFKYSLILPNFSIELKLAANKAAEAVKEAQAAIARFPTSRALAHRYAEALFATKQYEKTADYLRTQMQLYRNDAQIRQQLAKVYDAQGKKAQMHMALAESYSLTGGLASALEQLTFARRAPDVTFYDLSIIDAHEREWQKQRLEQMKEKS